MTPALVDDRYLSEVLRGIELPQLEGRALFTTGYWYVRLCQAVLAGRRISGVLSGPFASLPDSIRSQATAAVMQLPDAVGLGRMKVSRSNSPNRPCAEHLARTTPGIDSMAMADRQIEECLGGYRRAQSALHEHPCSRILSKVIDEPLCSGARRSGQPA